MADEQEEILETDDVNMDYRKMRQTHELVKYVTYFKTTLIIDISNKKTYSFSLNINL